MLIVLYEAGGDGPCHLRGKPGLDSRLPASVCQSLLLRLCAEQTANGSTFSLPLLLEVIMTSVHSLVT